MAAGRHGIRISEARSAAVVPSALVGTTAAPSATVDSASLF